MIIKIPSTPLWYSCALNGSRFFLTIHHTTYPLCSLVTRHREGVEKRTFYFLFCCSRKWKKVNLERAFTWLIYELWTQYSIFLARCGSSTSLQGLSPFLKKQNSRWVSILPHTNSEWNVSLQIVKRVAEKPIIFFTHRQQQRGAWWWWWWWWSDETRD